MAIETYPLVEDDHPLWGTLGDLPNGKPICSCLRLVEGSERTRVHAFIDCSNCKGFGFPVVPFEDVA